MNDPEASPRPVGERGAAPSSPSDARVARIRRSLDADPAAPLDESSVMFTEQFVTHLGAAIDVVPSHHAGGLLRSGTHRVLAARVGISRATTTSVVSMLTTLGLVAVKGDALGRTATGDLVRRHLRTSGTDRLALTIMRSGLMADQIRSLRLVMEREGDTYTCSRGTARARAPQLVGLLLRCGDVTEGTKLHIGADTALELDSVWNEVHPSSRVDWDEIDKRKRAVGARAEVYSMQFERSRAVGAIERIIWVSQDDDRLGYDIEVAPGSSAEPTRTARMRPTADRHRAGQDTATAAQASPGTSAAAGRRFVEVKGASGADVQFFLSSNEYDVAARHGVSYEVQFWGRIDLRRDVVTEYDTLRAAGYPIVVNDPARVLHEAPWSIKPDVYKVKKLPI